MKAVEKIKTYSTSVSCSGKDVPYDHPKVYLKIDSVKGEVECPYCSKRFIKSD